MPVRTLSIHVVMVLLATLPSARGQEGPAADPARTASEPVFFDRHVMPLINKLGCNTARCHGTVKNGLRLSLFGASPRDDYAALTRTAGGRQVNRVEPARSLLLLKATGAIEHGGGTNLESGSPEYRTLLAWIARGTPRGSDQLPELVSIEASPKEQVLERGGAQQLRVTAVFSDGSREDVTGMAEYRTVDGAVASVDAGGTVKAAGPGDAAIIVGYLRRFDAVRCVVPQPLPTPFPEAVAKGPIDELVLANLRKLGIPPSGPCSDHEFLRRVYLDVVGTLPTPDEVRQFLSDADPGKRKKLIDRLLDSDEFADYWALKWGDLFRIKSEYPSRLWPNAVQAYHRWMRDAIKSNKPYDQFARELLTSSGSNFRTPEANYYRAFLQRDPQNLGEVTALIFMGARIGCARCHGHPTEDWSLDDNVGLAAFFARVRYKSTREWKEEIVYSNPRQTMRHPRTGDLVQPKFPGGEVLELEPDEDPRARFAAWLTSPENPWFARNIVNRIWFWLLGRGIIHEPDDLRSTNLPENPELLRYLERELVDSRYDLKHIYRLILNSGTYQRSARASEHNRNDVAHFSRYPVKRLGAETLLDAIGQVTERWDTFRSSIPEPFVVMPEAFRATHLADGSIDLPFLQLFGRPPRDTAYESDRDLELSMRQTLHLLNSSDVQNKINASPRLRRLLRETPEDSPIVEELFLSTVSRFPTDEERQRISDYLSGAGKALPPAVVAEEKAAREALAAAREEVRQASAACEAAEKAAGEAKATAELARAAATRTEKAASQAEKIAAGKGKEADDARKRAEEQTQNGGEISVTAVATLKAAEKAARDAKERADNARSQADRARAALKAAEGVAGKKQKLALEARGRRDQRVKNERATGARLAAATKKVDAARAALRPRRDQAIQDVLWALLNTKEFLFNH